MSKQKQQQLEKILLKQDTRVHILLAELINNGVLDWEDFLIRPQGTRTRAYLKEVIACEYKKVHPRQPLEKVLIDVNQEGIFDMLPDGLSHQPTHSDSYDSIKTYIEESNQQRKEREDSRRFFAPFEQETHRLRIKIAQQEQLSSVTINNPVVKAIFKDFWEENLDNLLLKEDINLITYLLPLAYRASSDLQLLERCLGIALQEKVVISTKVAAQLAVTSDIIPTLGNALLGLNMVLGESYKPLNKSIFAAIGPISAHKLKDYLPGRPKANLILWFKSFFLPFEGNFDFQILVKLKGESFILNENSYLGYSTTLN